MIIILWLKNNHKTVKGIIQGTNMVHMVYSNMCIAWMCLHVAIVYAHKHSYMHIYLYSHIVYKYSLNTY